MKIRFLNNFVKAFCLFIAISVFANVIFIKTNAESYTDSCLKNIVYLESLTADSKLSGDGTEASPYIIKTAEQLLYVIQSGKYATHDKFYKIDDSIDAIVLQPSEVVENAGGIEKLLNLSSYSEVEEYFSQADNWLMWPENTTEYFCGSFDGNSTAIYGMYTAGNETAALFSVVGTNATIKNLAVRNSYIKTAKHGAALVGITYGYTLSSLGITVPIGTVKILNCEISNCRIISSGSQKYSGIMLGRIHYTNTTATGLVIENCLVYENKMSFADSSLTDEQTNYLFGQTATSVGPTQEESIDIKNEFKNSIILDCHPCFYNAQQEYFEAAQNYFHIYSNYSANHPYYNSKQFKQFTATEKSQYSTEIEEDFDWSLWFDADETFPVLRSFHDISAADNGDGTHSEKCDCGLKGTASKHIFDEDYKCTVCKYQHEHKMVDVDIQSDADCVNNGIMNTKCENCDYTSTREIISIGHTFGEIIAATDGDCQTEATVAHKHCSVCNLTFASDADIHSSKPLQHIGTGYTGKHNWVAQTPVASACGGIEQIEYFKCAVCDKYMVYGIMTDTAPIADGHTLIKIEAIEPTCTSGGNIEYFDCQNCDKYFTTKTGEVEIAYEDTQISAINHKNKVHHNMVEADCLNDGNIEYWYCPNCNKNYSDEACTTVVESINIAAHGHEFGEIIAATSGDCETDGTVAHKICTVCENKYAESAQTNETQSLESISTGVKGEHITVKVNEVAATVEKDGTKEHYACEKCNKLFLDSEGKNEAKSEDLVIAKLQNTDDTATNQKPTETTKPTENKPVETVKPEIDQNNQSPATGENVSTMVALVILITAVSFVTLRKIKMV